MMAPREMVIELLAQTIAPRLYQLCGTKSEEMGFPIYDTKEEVENHLQQQFDPVAYWLAKAREISETLLTVVEAGGMEVKDESAVDVMCKAAAKFRVDVKADGTQLSMGDL